MASSARRPRTVAVAAVVVSAAVLLAGAPPAVADPPARGYTGGGQGYLLDEGRFRPIAVPGATGALPFGISDRGQVVGIYDDADGRSHGFLWERDRFRTQRRRHAGRLRRRGRPAPAGRRARRRAATRAPDHVRRSRSAVGARHGDSAYDINDRGQIVGAKLPPPAGAAAAAVENGVSGRADRGADGPGPG